MNKLRTAGMTTLLSLVSLSGCSKPSTGLQSPVFKQWLDPSYVSPFAPRNEVSPAGEASLAEKLQLLEIDTSGTEPMLYASVHDGRRFPEWDVIVYARDVEELRDSIAKHPGSLSHEVRVQWPYHLDEQSRQCIHAAHGIQDGWINLVTKQYHENGTFYAFKGYFDSGEISERTLFQGRPTFFSRKR